MANSPSPLTLAAICLLSIVSAEVAKAQSLEQAARLMLYQEPELQAANYDRLSSIEHWKVARGDLMPRVSLDGSVGYQKRDRSTDGLVTSSGDGLMSRQIGISIQQLLFDGGATRQGVLSARKGTEVQEFLERSMVELRMVDLCEVYQEVLRAKDRLRAAQERVNRHKDIRDMIKELVGNGGNRADLALVDGRLSLAVNTVESQQLILENALIRFVRLTGEPASNLGQPNVPQLPSSREDVVLDGNWDYQAALAALEVSEHDYKSARGKRGPKVYFDAGASKGEDVLGVEGEDDEVRAMIVMSWELFRGGANKALQQREHWQVRKAEELVKAAQQQGDYQASLLWKEREGSAASVRSMEAYVQRLEGVLSDYAERFKVGRQDLLSILDVHSELYTAKTKLIDARYNVDTSAFRLMGVQGLLTNFLVSEEEVREYLDRNPDKDPLPESLLMVKGLSEEPEHDRAVVEPLSSPEGTEVSSPPSQSVEPPRRKRAWSPSSRRTR